MTAAAVIVPARDAAATLGATLDGLAAQTVSAEVIVVDNGSRDATAALAAAHPAVAQVVRRERGEGPGAARNAGVAATDADMLAFTDADCVPAPGWLATGLRALDAADLVQGRVTPAGPVGRFDHSLWVEGETGLFETANLFVSRVWFDRVGGFGPGIAAAGRPFGEDVLFGWAAVRAGARTAFSAEALVHHAVVAGDLRAHLAERRRLQHFPALLRAVPELRDALFARAFLTRRSAAFDLAALGLAARRPLLAVPYLALRPRPLADAVGAAALVYGSLRARTLVL
jgi:glycosyltransferase involved in cell wall biosynthesis